MSLNLGSTSIDSLYLGSTKIGEAYLGSTKVYASVDPYNPLGLPPNTIRVRLNAYASDPTDQGDIRVCVDAENKIWDITKNSNDWGTDTHGGETYIVGSWLTKNLIIEEVLGANTSNVTNMEGLFGGGAFFLSRIALFDTRNVTNMVSFCNSVPISSIPKFDTRNVTDMRGMLQNCYQLTSLPDFDLSSVTDMSKAFFNTAAVESGALALYQAASTLPNVPTHTDTFKDCGKDTQTGAAELAQIPPSWGGTMDYNPLGLPDKTIRAKFSAGYTPTMGDSQTLVDAGENIWDITKNSTIWQSLFYQSSIVEVIGANSAGVTYMTEMFEHCGSLTSVSLFDTSSVTDMRYMFNGCTGLTSVPLFDTSSVTNMQFMFDGCTSLMSVPHFDTSSVMNMQSMLSGCGSLTSVPLFDTSSATNMGKMFDYCTGLTSVPLFDTSSAIDVTYMFRGCRSLTSVPLFDTSSATAMWDMFNGCTGLTSVPLLDTSSATSTSRLLNGCTAVQGGALALYRQASSQATPPASHDNMFTDCGSGTANGLAELQQIPRSWGGLLGTELTATWDSDAQTAAVYAWTCGATSPDWSTEPPLNVFTTQKIVSQGNGVNMDKSRIKNIQNGLATSGAATYYRIAFVQFDSTIPGALSWVLTTTGYQGTLNASTTRGDMSGYLDYATYGPTDKHYGTYDSSKPVYFCLLVTNADPTTWGGLTDAYGIHGSSANNFRPTQTLYWVPASA